LPIDSLLTRQHPEIRVLFTSQAYRRPFGHRAGSRCRPALSRRGPRARLCACRGAASFNFGYGELTITEKHGCSVGMMSVRAGRPMRSRSSPRARNSASIHVATFETRCVAYSRARRTSYCSCPRTISRTLRHASNNQSQHSFASLWSVADPALHERKSELGQLDLQLAVQLEIASPQCIMLG